MNGTENGVKSGTANGRSGVEDLDAVLGRFQDWASQLRANPAAGRLATRVPHRDSASVSVPNKPSGEARDVSYEQALRASSYRRPEDLDSVDPPLPIDPVKASAMPNGQTSLSTTALWETAWTATMRPEQSISTTQTRITHSPIPEPLKASPAEPPPVAPQIKHEEPPSIPPAPVMSGAIVEDIGAKTGRVEVAGARSSLALDASSPTISLPKASPAARSPRKQPLAQPAFRDVLKGTAALVAAAQSGAVQERGKSAALTLRVSDGEQAHIQACAARANLSVSAYLRQCALGVDELRAQVQMALTTLHDQQTRAVPPPGIEAIPGILGRFAKQCWRRLRRTPEEYTVVSIR